MEYLNPILHGNTLLECTDDDLFKNKWYKIGNIWYKFCSDGKNYHDYDITNIENNNWLEFTGKSEQLHNRELNTHDSLYDDNLSYIFKNYYWSPDKRSLLGGMNCPILFYCYCTNLMKYNDYDNSMGVGPCLWVDRINRLDINNLRKKDIHQLLDSNLLNSKMRVRELENIYYTRVIRNNLINSLKKRRNKRKTIKNRKR
mgnify:CR=1 FL=1|tara:strand:- start:943 stop:1542 length:600 start_codon:yes stop_codon:yes gene_type:complete